MQSRQICLISTLAAFCILNSTLTVAVRLHAHSGPPYPIVSDRRVGTYVVSVWTDPDATDDRSLGGQFWVLVEPKNGGTVAPDTRARISVRAADRAGHELIANAEPVRGDVGNQFAAVLMDHEGPYDVLVTVSGSGGDAEVEARVDATYDLRPPPYMLVWYLLPFLAVGALWTRLLIRRRGARAGPAR